MEPFRLEEMLRILLIALISAAVGVAGYFASEFLTEGHANAGSLFGAILIFFLPAWPIASVLAFVLGLLLHIAIRRWSPPRVLLLPLFAVTGAATTWLLFQRHGGGLGFQFMALITSTVAWLLYCFGPRPLWRYHFDPASDSDF